MLHLTGSETYALTHCVFYATDFGQHACPDTPGSAALREAVRVLLGVHLARRNLDLLSELLLCARALGGPAPAFEGEGWEALAAAQRCDDAVPSPVHRPEVLQGLTGDQAAAYLKMSSRLLKRLRRAGKGPVFRRHSRFVQYHIDDLDSWSSEHSAREIDR